MSLNRCEQRVFDYLQHHGDERHFWQEKVRTISLRAGDDHVAAPQIARELWSYYRERSEVVPVFREAVRHEGLQQVSMKNLAEYLIRLWTEPRPKKKTVPTVEYP